MPNINAAGGVQAQLNRMTPAAKRALMGDVLADLINSLQNRVVQQATLAIKAGSSAIVRTTTPLLYKVGDELLRKAAGDLSALVGTLATAKSAAWAFYIDGSGTVTTAAKTADATTHDAALALVTAPPVGKIMFGVVVIDNATGSNFVGGTTALDVGSLTVTYYSTSGARVSRGATKDLETRY